jgi:hypothetical protein
MASNSTLRNVGSTAGIFPFLLLPAEIRLQIYGIIAIPDTDLVSSYKGLFLSCKQIKDEMEDEFTYVFGKHIQPLKSAMAAELPGSSVQLVPERFSGSYRLKITLPTLRWTSILATYYRYPKCDAFFSLLKLPLDSLSLNLTLSRDLSTLPDYPRWGGSREMAIYQTAMVIFNFNDEVSQTTLYGPTCRTST